MPDAPPATAAPAPPLLGVQAGDSETESGSRAAVVYFVLPDGPAAKSGIRESDKILSLGGKAISSSRDLFATLRGLQPDSNVPAVIVRQGQRTDMTVRLGAAIGTAASNQRWLAYLAQREQDELRAGIEAEQAGDRLAAFGHFVRSARAGMYATLDTGQALPYLAALLPALRPPPATPVEAQRLNDQAMSLVQGAHNDGDNDRAADSIRGAVFAAPWIADLYVNQSVVLSRVGRPKQAATALRRYLLLNPKASDAAEVRRKIGDLDLQADAQGPWLPFVNKTWKTSDSGGTMTVALRGDTLNVTVVTPQPGTDQKAGDRLCWGTVNGTSFSGLCTMWMKDETSKACFGAKREYEADGGIAEDGALKIMTTTNLNYGTSSCVINSEERGTRIWIRTGAGNT